MPTAPASRTSTRDLGDAPLRASEVHVSCGLLYDLVVLAGGPASKLSPLCNETAKPMLSIGNRPLIWYVVRPWIEKGARSMFICAPDYAVSSIQIVLERDFPNVAFKFVVVSPYRARGDAGGRSSGAHEDDDDDPVGIPTTSCDALSAYYAYKRSLRMEGGPEGLPRDALVVSGDTILAKLDIVPFIDNFYSSYASANVLLWRPRPKDKPAEPTEPAKKGAAKVAKPTQRFPGKKEWQHDLSCVAYEETMPNALAPTAAVSSTSAPDGGDALVSHHRLHYLQPLSDSPTPTLSMGFAARRPNLTFCADVVDAHVYLLRHWVVEFVACVAKDHPMLIDDIPALKLDILPLLARSQHALVHSGERQFRTPFEKLLVDKMASAISADWAIDLSSTRSIGSLNAMRLSSNPTAPPCNRADALRVCCTIYEEPKHFSVHPQAIRRVHTRENYLAIHHEILQMLPPQGQAASPDDVTAVGLMCLDAFAEEHDAVVSAAPLAHVTQSLLRSPPTNSETFITRSVIGQRVTMGKNVRVTNSVIGDNVELENNTTITNSVIGAGATVKDGVTISSSFAAPQVLVTKDASDTVVTTEG